LSKISKIRKKARIPITAYLAPAFNSSRKPNVGMWEHFRKKVSFR